jgi:hypothetical protein
MLAPAWKGGSMFPPSSGLPWHQNCSKAGVDPERGCRATAGCGQAARHCRPQCLWPCAKGPPCRKNNYSMAEQRGSMKHLPAYMSRKCARCREYIDSAPLFQDNEWYHHPCWEEGVRQLQHAAEVFRQLDSEQILHRARWNRRATERVHEMF